MKCNIRHNMKRSFLIILIICGIGIFANAQTPVSSSEEEYYRNLNLSPKDTLMFQYFEAFHSQLREPRYQLFKTQNMWTFLKLDTMTGQIWQVQFSVKGGDYRFETALDTSPRISEYFDEPICGRFTLYATDNMYNFIMLDQIDGRCWQVQWSSEPENRGVIRIY